MRSGRTAAAAALLGLMLLLPGCGEGGTATAGGEKAAGGDEAAKSSSRPAAKPRTHAAARRCARTLGDFLDSMESLANTLAVGLAYDQYLDTVNRVRVTYAEVDAERLGIVCLGRVAAPAERALNVYIEAANRWGECLAGSECDSGSIEGELQLQWEQASALLAEARGSLRAMGRR